MVNTQIRSLTSAEYYQMMESGIIREGEKVELILGQIFTMAAKGTRHTVVTRKLFKQLLALIGDRADVQSQDPITLPNNSEPEPDIVIARLRLDDYANSHPSPADIILVIEVADSSIKFDRDTKAPLYAAAGISEYWIVNLIDNRLEIYRQPEGDIYASIEMIAPPSGQSLAGRDSIGLPHFSDILLNIGDFFPALKTEN
jgi:Uma2 family endonuclease